MEKMERGKGEGRRLVRRQLSHGAVPEMETIGCHELDGREEESAEFRFVQTGEVVVTKKVTQEEGRRFGGGDIYFGNAQWGESGKFQATWVGVTGDSDLQLGER